MNIEFRLAAYDEKTILRNLLELAQYDYSEFDGYDVNDHGVYGYKFLDHYWTDPQRYPFIVKADGKLAGFALVRVCDHLADGTPVYSIAEFCILRKYRGQGVGQEVARRIFAMFPGSWSLWTCANNNIARTFWKKVTADYARSAFAVSEHNDSMVEMKFEIPSA
ncbi:MAG: acetyltransferase [Paenibacillus sp.]|jgi:predicted acetyltransferase|nr:acetyltransferase [Paenibacillus sp.]